VDSAYLHLARAQLRAQAQYRFSFVVDVVGTTLASTFDFVSVLVLFRVTRSLGGFGVREAFLMTCVAGAGFTVADLVIGNVDQVRDTVRTGRLDALLIRPLGVLPQLVASDFTPRRLGRVTQSVVLLAVAVHLAGVHWTPARAVLVVLAPLAGAVFFGSWFVATATVTFWWVESGELSAAFTYGGKDFTGYPLTVYSGLFRRTFGYALGFAFIAYYPTLALLGRPDPLGAPAWLGWCTPVISAASAGVAAVAWRTGIRHYRSTGS
jgi:ABC-2 type transport system permease protein